MRNRGEDTVGTIGLILMFIPLAIAAACFIISALQFMQIGRAHV